MKLDINNSERILKVLANRRRLKIIDYIIKKKESSVSGIASEIKLSLKATSKHMHILFTAGILERDQKGLEVYYRLAKNQNPLMRQILLTL